MSKIKKKKSIGVYFSLFMGTNLRIKRFNLQSLIHVLFPTLENQVQMNKFTDSFQKLRII
jgi:hypothetical protein